MASSSHNTFEGEGVDDDKFDQYFDQKFEIFSIDPEEEEKKEKTSSYRAESWRRRCTFTEWLFQWNSNIPWKSIPTPI